MLGIEPRSLCMLCKCSTIELYPQSFLLLFKPQGLGQCLSILAAHWDFLESFTEPWCLGSYPRNWFIWTWVQPGKSTVVVQPLGFSDFLLDGWACVNFTFSSIVIHAQCSHLTSSLSCEGVATFISFQVSFLTAFLTSSPSLFPFFFHYFQFIWTIW